MASDIYSALAASQTPQQLYFRRMLEEGSNSSPIQSWTQGASRLAHALLAGMAMRNQGDEEGKKFDTMFPGGAAVAAAPTTAASPIANALAGTSPDIPGRIVSAESGGNQFAKNPNSSAAGPGQFIDSTWLETLKRARPDLAAGKDDATILGMRTDPRYKGLSEAMTGAYAQQNAGTLDKAGLPVTPGTTYLAHFAGPGGATKILSADPNTPVGSLLSPDAMKANPFLANMTAGQLRAWADNKMGGPQVAQGDPAALPPTAQPTQGYAIPGQGQQGQRQAPQIPQDVRERARKMWMAGEKQMAAALLQPYMAPKDQWQEVKRPGQSSVWVNTASGEPKFEPPGMSVSLSADKEGAELMAKKGIEGFDLSQGAARDATRRIASYGQMSEAMKAFTPGATAEVRLKGAQILKDLGIPVDANGVASGETFKAAQRRLELAATPKGQGQITENERALIREQIPTIATSPEGVVKITQALDRLDRYDLEVARIYRDNARKHGGSKINYLEVTDEIAKLGPPMTENEMAALTSVRGGEVPKAATPAPTQGGVRRFNPATGKIE